MHSVMASKVQVLWEQYKHFVVNKTDLVCQIESVVRCLSYIIPARFENSTLISELLYSASNLLVLLNDTILRKDAKIKEPAIASEDASRLQKLLCVLEAVEVFMELTAGKIFSSVGRWAIILAIQIAKAVIRLVLLFKHQRSIQISPPLPNLDRKACQKNKETETQPLAPANGLFEKLTNNNAEELFVLKRSGRQMRTLKSAPPLMYRDWKLPSKKTAEAEAKKLHYIPTLLNETQVKAELLHIIRPLVHLLGLYMFGQTSWKPWMLACSLDVSSLCLMGEPSKFTPTEQAELRRRSYLLVLYLLRSPFYDRIAKARVLLMLHMMSNGVPLLGWLAKPLADYLPVWQKIYSYVWSI